MSSNYGPDTIPLFRLLSVGTDMDHMVSSNEVVPGYQWEAFLEYSYSAALDAIFPIQSLVKPDPVDHLTAFYSEMVEGYLDDGILGYGYPRFGENDAAGKQHNPILSQIAHNGVAINADLSWGGVIYELWWNGKQFVNHNDCGRETQTALFKPGSEITSSGRLKRETGCITAVP